MKRLRGVTQPRLFHPLFVDRCALGLAGGSTGLLRAIRRMVYRASANELSSTSTVLQAIFRAYRQDHREQGMRFMQLGE